MARLTDIEFQLDGRTYRLDINLDDAAMMQDQLAVELQAEVIEADGESNQLDIRLEVDLEKDEARVLYEGRTLHVLSLDKVRETLRMTNESEDIPGMEGEEGGDPTGENIASELGDLLDIIDNIPTPDPLLCLLKAGISSTVGQVLVCNEISGSAGGEKGRVWRVASCLRDHVGGLFTRTLWRTAKCIVTMF